MATYRECKTLKFPGSEIVYQMTDDTKVAKNQGIDNAGKVLGVDSNGLVTLMNVESAGTGSSGTSSITVDAAMSSTSTNPVQNKVIKEAIDECITSMSVSGKTITYKKKDGSIGTITTQDTNTTYTVATTTTNGLMSSTDKETLDNIGATIDNKIKAAIEDAIGGSY